MTEAGVEAEVARRARPRTVSCLFTALLACGCTYRAAVPPPHLPLVSTPASALPAAPSDAWPSPPLELRFIRHQLDNGVRVVFAPGAPNGVSSVVLVSSATPRWDARAPAIVTSWMSHMMLRATATDEGVVDDLLTRRGFSPSLEVGASGLIVRDRMPSEEVPAFLEALDEVLRAPAFRPADLAQRVEAMVDRTELELRGSGGMLDDGAPSLLYAAGDPRARSLRDRLPRMQALQVAELRARHRDLLDPSRVTIVVSGDVDPAALLATIDERFGRWPAHATEPELVPPRYRGSDGPRGRVVVRPALRAYLRLLERAPPFTHDDYAAFLVLEQILGGMFTSRLNLAVREGSGASYGFHARYAASAMEGAIEMETSVEPAYTRSVLEGMIAELRRVRGQGVGVEAAELQLARTRARETLLAQVDSSAGVAIAAARRAQVGLAPGAFAEVIDALDALDPDAVEAAARRWLRPERATLLLVVRPEHLDDVLRAGVGLLEVVRVRRR